MASQPEGTRRDRNQNNSLRAESIADAWISSPRLPRRLIIARKVIIRGDELDATCNRTDARGHEVACRTREADRTNRSRNGTVPTVRIDRPPNGRDRSESE